MDLFEDIFFLQCIINTCIFNLFILFLNVYKFFVVEHYSKPNLLGVGLELLLCTASIAGS